MSTHGNQQHAWGNKAARSSQISLWRQFSGALFLMIFGGVFLYFLIPELGNYVRAATWRPTPCTILASRIEIVKNSDLSGGGMSRNLSRPIISYSYQIEHKEYQSDRYSFLNPATSGSRANDVVLKYPAGATTTCYVNLDNPAEVILNRRFSAFNFILLIPGAIFLLGLISFFIFAKNCVRRIFEDNNA